MSHLAFVMNIQMHSAQFKPDPAKELARRLRSYADFLEATGEVKGAEFTDLDGNIIGGATVIGKEIISTPEESACIEVKTV